MKKSGNKRREVVLRVGDNEAGSKIGVAHASAIAGVSLMSSLELLEDRLAALISETTQSASRYQMLYESTPAMLYSIDSDGRLLYVSDFWLAVSGYTRQEVIGRLAIDFWPFSSHESATQTIPELFHVGRLSGVERQLVCKNGALLDILIFAVTTRDAHGRLMSLSVMQDVTERNRAQAALIAAHERLQVTLDSIGDGVITTGRDGKVDYLNPVAEKLTGWGGAEAIGLPLEKVFSLNVVNDDIMVPRWVSPLANGTSSANLPKASDQVLLSRDGREYRIENSASMIKNTSGDIVGTVFVFRDVSESVQLHRAILYRATRDSLTGALNRDEFERRVRAAVDSAQLSGAAYALMYIDLDRFKVVNDAGGHAVGDRLLKQVVSLIGRVLRPGDVLARLGGDEFGVLMRSDGRGDPQAVANQICRELDAFRFRERKLNLHIGASIGLVLIDKRWATTASALQAADSACYAAKAAGRNRVHTYVETDEVIESYRGGMQWVRRLETALDKGQFALHWQRIGSLEPDGVGIHGEVLLRLVGDNGELVFPGLFLDSAERFQMASRIDRWVVREVFTLMTSNKERSEHLTTVSINLSGQSIGDRDFHNYVLDLMDRMAFDKRKLCFEITETAVITNMTEAHAFFQSMRARGVRFALDDFGSGVSSFGYLKALPVDYLKIDGQFIKGLVDDPVDQATVRCISEVARITGKKTVAEFVETEAVERMLKDIGIDYAQGFLRHRPAPIDQMFEASERIATAL